MRRRGIYKFLQIQLHKLFNLILYVAATIVEGQDKESIFISTQIRRNLMREYSKDKPEAVARILILALLADGTVNRSETRFLERKC